MRNASFIALLVALGVVLFVPSFAADELDDEEGRRALPAREMIASGDYVLPTIFGAPYLAKPPLFFWAVAAASCVTGGVNEAATRLPSVVATIATAVSIYIVGRRAWNERTGRLSALLYLCTLGVFEKGAFGELEAVFSLTTFLASAASYSALTRRTGRAQAEWMATSCFAAALLTKGPPAYVFYVATISGLAIARKEPSLLRSARAWRPLTIGTALASIWVLLVVARPEVGGAVEHWGAELARGDGDGLSEYLRARWKFLVGTAASFLPSTAIWAVSLGCGMRPRDTRARTAEWIVAVGLTFFGLMPGTHARYVFPLVPWACLTAGSLLADLSDAKRFERRVAIGLRVLAGVALAGAACAGWLAAGGEIGGVTGLGLGGGAIALALIVAAATLWCLPASVGNTALSAAFAVLALLRGLQLVELIPDAADRRSRRACAQALESKVPYGAVMNDASTGAYNDLFYVRAPIEAVANPLALEPGAIVVMRVEDLAQLERWGSVDRVLSTAKTHEGVELAVAVIGPKSP